MTPDAPLQDAVTLAADLQRTPVQQAARALYLELIKEHGPFPRGYLQKTWLENAQELMHEDDCE